MVGKGYLGSGRHLLPSEVPTLRACLRQAIFFQEEKVLSSEVNRRNYPVKDMMNDVTEKIYIQWQKYNVQFEDPVVIKKISVVKRLIEAWYKFSNIEWGKIKKTSGSGSLGEKVGPAPRHNSVSLLSHSPLLLPFISLFCEGAS